MVDANRQIREHLKTKQNGQNGKTDLRRGPHEFNEGGYVFLQIFPMKRRYPGAR